MGGKRTAAELTKRARSGGVLWHRARGENKQKCAYACGRCPRESIYIFRMPLRAVLAGM